MKWRVADGIDEIWNCTVGEKEPNSGRITLNGSEKQRRQSIQVLDGVHSAAIKRRTCNAGTSMGRRHSGVVTSTARLGADAGAIARLGGETRHVSRQRGTNLRGR